MFLVGKRKIIKASRALGVAYVCMLEYKPDTDPWKEIKNIAPRFSSHHKSTWRALDGENVCKIFISCIFDALYYHLDRAYCLVSLHI